MSRRMTGQGCSLCLLTQFSAAKPRKNSARPLNMASSVDTVSDLPKRRGRERKILRPIWIISSRRAVLSTYSMSSRRSMAKPCTPVGNSFMTISPDAGSSCMAGCCIAPRRPTSPIELIFLFPHVKNEAVMTDGKGVSTGRADCGQGVSAIPCHASSAKAQAPVHVPLPGQTKRTCARPYLSGTSWLWSRPAAVKEAASEAGRKRTPRPALMLATMAPSDSNSMIWGAPIPSSSCQRSRSFREKQPLAVPAGCDRAAPLQERPALLPTCAGARGAPAHGNGRVGLLASLRQARGAGCRALASAPDKRQVRQATQQNREATAFCGISSCVLPRPAPQPEAGAEALCG